MNRQTCFYLKLGFGFRYSIFYGGASVVRQLLLLLLLLLLFRAYHERFFNMYKQPQFSIIFPWGPHGDPMAGLSRPGSLGRAPDTGWRVPPEGFQKKKRREQTKRSIRIERHDTIDPTRAAFSSDRLRFGTNGLGATACPKASCMKLLAWVAQHALRFHFDLFTSISRSNSLRSHFETNPSPTPPKRTDPSPKRTNPFSNPSPKRTNPPPTPPKRTNPSPKRKPNCETQSIGREIRKPNCEAQSIGREIRKPNCEAQSIGREIRKPNCETQSIRRVIRNDSDDGNENEHEKKRN